MGSADGMNMRDPIIVPAWILGLLVAGTILSTGTVVYCVRFLEANHHFDRIFAEGKASGRAEVLTTLNQLLWMKATTEDPLADLPVVPRKGKRK